MVLAGLAVSLAYAAGPDGAALYDAQCAKCHGATGAADTAVGKALKATAFNEPKWAKVEAAEIVRTFHENSKHKAVASVVSDADLEAITQHLHVLAEGGGGGS
jgi:mono/diheme cytochrome c family protein